MMLGFCFVALCGCGEDEGDYFYVAGIEGQGDGVLIKFLYTCGKIDVSWNGVFMGEKPIRGELSIRHDAEGKDCDIDRRLVPFDVGPMKRSFREQNPEPEPLGLRIPLFEKESGAVCLMNLFREEPFKSQICE